MVGADETMELWRPPLQKAVYRIVIWRAVCVQSIKRVGEHFETVFHLRNPLHRL